MLPGGGEVTVTSGITEGVSWQLRHEGLRLRAWPGESTAIAFDADACRGLLLGAEHAQVLSSLAPGTVLGEPVLRARFEGLDVCRILRELEEAGFARRLEQAASVS